MKLPQKYQNRWVYAATAAILASIFNAFPLMLTLGPESLFGRPFPFIILTCTYIAGLMAWHDCERWWGDSFFMGIKTVTLSFLILGVIFALIILTGMLLEQGRPSLILAGIVILAIFIFIPLLWNYFDHSRWSGFYMASGLSLLIMTLLFFLFRQIDLNFFIVTGEILFMLAVIPVGTFVFGSFITLGIPYLIGGVISLLFTSQNQANIAPSPK